MYSYRACIAACIQKSTGPNDNENAMTSLKDKIIRVAILPLLLRITQSLNVPRISHGKKMRENMCSGGCRGLELPYWLLPPLQGIRGAKENEEEEKKRRLQPPYGCELDPPLNRCFLNFSTSVIERDQTYELENCR